MLVLVEEIFAAEEVHLLKLGEELPEELGWLVGEELDGVCDVDEDLLGHLSLQCYGELVEDLVDFHRDDLFVVAIVLDVGRDVLLQLLWDPVPLRKLQQGVQLDLQVISSYVDLVEDGLDVSNDVGIEADPEDHPEDSDNAFIVPYRSYIAVANRRQGLEGPVHRSSILVESVGV